MKMVIYITVVQLWTGRNMSDWFEGHKHTYQELSECAWGWRKRQSWELEVGDCWLTIDDGDEEVSPSWSSFSAVPVLLASQRKPGSLVWLRPSSDDDLRQKVKRKSLEFQVSLLSSKFLKFIELSAKHSMLVMWLHCVCVCVCGCTLKLWYWAPVTGTSSQQGKCAFVYLYCVCMGEL